MWNLNIYLFELINATPDTPNLFISLARLFSEAPQFIMLGLFGIAFLLRPKETFIPLSATGVGVILAMTVNYLIGQAIPVERPFVQGIGYQWLSHSADPSFPSDHVTFLFATVAGCLFFKELRSLALPAISLVLLNAWARIFVGIHFPADILGALAVGISTGAFAKILSVYFEEYLQNLLFARKIWK